MRSPLVLFAALSLTAAAFGAEAATVCKDAKGVVIKCPAPGMMMAGGKPHCKDPKTGLLEKCTMPASVTATPAEIANGKVAPH